MELSVTGDITKEKTTLKYHAWFISFFENSNTIENKNQEVESLYLWNIESINGRYFILLFYYFSYSFLGLKGQIINGSLAICADKEYPSFRFLTWNPTKPHIGEISEGNNF